MDALAPLYRPARDGFSPLVLVDRLISLAQETDRAGHRRVASGLVALAHAVCDEPAPPAPASA